MDMACLLYTAPRSEGHGSQLVGSPSIVLLSKATVYSTYYIVIPFSIMRLLNVDATNDGQEMVKCPRI